MLFVTSEIIGCSLGYESYSLPSVAFHGICVISVCGGPDFSHYFYSKSKDIKEHYFIAYVVSLIFFFP